MVFKKSTQEGSAVTIDEDLEGSCDFYREATIHKSLENPYTVQLHALSELAWLVMELADESLREWYQNKQDVAWSLKIKVLQLVAVGLSYMHCRRPRLCTVVSHRQHFCCLMSRGQIVQSSNSAVLKMQSPKGW